MPDSFNIDKRRLRRAFGQAAAGYDAAAVLQHEVCERMLSRLDYIRNAPAFILDAGSGTGNVVAALRKRYPRAALCALDIAMSMVKRACDRVPRWRRMLGDGVLPLCADIEQLPLRAAAIDMVWSNLALQWVNDTQQAFAEMRRVLSPGGLLMFSTFGPDTLKELRAAYQDVDGYAHVNRFIDMHDLGDMLVRAGFADPVMDMEMITMTYGDVRALMHDLKSIGAGNAMAGRRRGLNARALLAQVEHRYEVWRRDGRLPATFEVVYGHAWVPPPRIGSGGRPVIPITPQP